MRRALTAAVVAALALAGCGGEQLEADEVPGAPAALTLPPDEALPSPAADTDTDADADADATPTPTPTADAAAGTTGGTTAAPAVTPAAPATGTTTTPPTSTTGGAGADGNFEDFCAQNPGAC